MSECNIGCDGCGGITGDDWPVIGMALMCAFAVISQKEITSETRSACDDMLAILMELYPDHHKLKCMLDEAKELFAG